MRVMSIALALSLAAGSVQAFTAINGLKVRPAGAAGAFEVIGRAGSGPRDVWCAAAQYTAQVLGPGGGQRIYLSDPMQPRADLGGRRSARFTIRPDAALQNGSRPGAGGNYNVSLSRVGFSLNIGHAGGMCEPLVKKLFDW